MFISLLMMDAEQGLRHTLVKQHGGDGNHHALDDVQGGYADHDEGGHIGDIGIDLGTHSDDGVQRELIKLGEFRQQIDGIEGAAQDGHGSGAENQTHNGGMLTLVSMVEEGGRQDEGAADDKIGKVTHKSGRGALQHQLQQNLDAFTDYSGTGSQIEAAEQDRQFREVQLIESGGQKQQGEIQHVQHGGNCGANADDTDAAGRTYTPAFRQKVFHKFCS